MTPIERSHYQHQQQQQLVNISEHFIITKEWMQLNAITIIVIKLNQIYQSRIELLFSSLCMYQAHLVYHLVNVISYGPAASTKATCNNYPEMDQSLVDKH
jgi:hypothetical protein